MKQVFSSDQRGIGHIGLILAVVVVLAMGGVGYFVFNKNKDGGSATDNLLQEALKNAKCDYDDEDLCKFFTSYKAQKYFTMNSTTVTDGEMSTMVVKSEGTDKSHIKLGGTVPYEVITIGKVSYTKAADGTWWKQTQTSDGNTASDLQGDAKVEFDEPATSDTAKTTYKKIGKEACGNLSCFKYQEVDADKTGATTYLWFDDKDYQLRRTLTESADSKSDSSYNYDKVSIKEPTPVKELGPNQYLIPGQTEPTTLPGTDSGMPTPEELEQLMQQYQ